MAAGPLDFEGCGTLLEDAEEMMSQDNLNAGSGSGWMGVVEEPQETKHGGVSFLGLQANGTYRCRPLLLYRCCQAYSAAVVQKSIYTMYGIFLTKN